jgi:hypothetical protein
MNERVKFAAAMLEAEERFAELCERFGSSSKQGYEWNERYDADGCRRWLIAREHLAARTL